MWKCKISMIWCCIIREQGDWNPAMSFLVWNNVPMLGHYDGNLWCFLSSSLLFICDFIICVYYWRAVSSFCVSHLRHRNTTTDCFRHASRSNERLHFIGEKNFLESEGENVDHYELMHWFSFKNNVHHYELMQWLGVIAYNDYVHNYELVQWLGFNMSANAVTQR